MTSAIPTFTLHLPCTKCASLFSASITGETAAELDRLGVTPEEVMDRIERRVLSWELTCPSCAAVASN
jgi:hypothetical protein